jgi:hypothetical protein
MLIDFGSDAKILPKDVKAHKIFLKKSRKFFREGKLDSEKIF